MKRQSKRDLTIFAVVTGAAALFGAAAAAIARDHAKERPPPATPGEYAGVETCKKCHFKDYKVWKATPHAKAFEILPEKYRADAQCLVCHTTGFGQPGGFTSIAETKEKAGVGCEMCHGPTGAHAAFATEHEKEKDTPEVKAKIVELAGGELGKSACWRCHLDQTHGTHPDFEGKKKS